jgi:hypothetical protein
MDAFTGILRVLEHSKGQEFFWGMPKSRFELSLAWVGNEALRRNTACQVIGGRQSDCFLSLSELVVDWVVWINRYGCRELPWFNYPPPA